MRYLINNIRKRISSFGFAFAGIWKLIKSEPNARIHLAMTIIAIIAGFLFHISSKEWSLIIFAIAIVWAAEAFNTAIEKLTDHIFTGYDETAKNIKDIAAGAVLICAIAAFITGILIFLPKIF